ncbi:MAG TPA: NAD(P)/FAD-dependent oxidoreductase, partial [Chitinophagaceae bacterium]
MPSFPNKSFTGKSLVVIGGGAAGFFCAVNAARLNPSLKVILLEKTNKLLSKVRISGGGRCNVTHALFDIDEFSKRYPRGQRFVRKAFHQFFSSDTVQWFESRGVKLKAEEDGRMFPDSDSSQTIINCLVNEANLYGVDIRLNSEVTGIEKKDLFSISLANNQTIHADYLSIATGGYPKTSMFGWLKELGHNIAEPVPSLFTFNLPKHPITALMGVAVENVRVKIHGSKLVQEGPLLVTHWGLSGPAILKLSAWGAKELNELNYHFSIHINWIPGYDYDNLKNKFAELRKTSGKKIENENFTQLPLRIWKFLLEQSGIDERLKFTELSSKSENLLIKNLLDYTADVKGKTTFKEEFVTAGGIELGEIEPSTMMSK